jgi:hypothetical protein
MQLKLTKIGIGKNKQVHIIGDFLDRPDFHDTGNANTDQRSQAICAVSIR